MAKRLVFDSATGKLKVVDESEFDPDSVVGKS